MKNTERKTEYLPSLPKRDEQSSKRDFGRLLIAAGSVGYTGAATLCARAAVRGGAGLVYLGVPESIYTITAVKNDEAMPLPLPCDDRGRLCLASLDGLREKLSRCRVLAVGPGLGRSEELTELVRSLLSEYTGRAVVDADALYALDADFARSLRCEVVLTPHEGEFLALGGDLSRGRTRGALSLAERFGCAVVLKGHESVCAFPDGEYGINRTGNAGMARGGSGDVLTGIMAAMLCQLPFKKAVVTAVHLHGLCGDMCAERLGEYGMTPSDMIEALPFAMKSVTEE